MKFFVAVPVIAVVLGLSLGPAEAFQETTIGTGAQPQAKAAEQPAGQAPVTGPAGLAIMTPEQTKAAEKSDPGRLRIPGLGELGVLPKMNFGLELLYGQGETGEPAAKPQDAPIDDLMIRGSVKHNF